MESVHKIYSYQQPRSEMGKTVNIGGVKVQILRPSGKPTFSMRLLKKAMSELSKERQMESPKQPSRAAR